jgi:hypothetical protein
MKLDKHTAEILEDKGWSLAGALGGPAYPARQNCRWTDREDASLRKDFDFYVVVNNWSLICFLARAAARHYRSVGALRCRLEHLELIDPQGYAHKSRYKNEITASSAASFGAVAD